jgi:hypothetical protein
VRPKIVDATVATAIVSPHRQISTERASVPLTLLAYGFGALGVAINVWNARTAAPADMILSATTGVLAEGVTFFLPAWALTLPPIRRILAFVLLVFLIVPFALTNNLRMASIISADATMARADRPTAGTEKADNALAQAQAARDQACTTRKPTEACKQRENEVARLQNKPIEAQNKVAAAARPESADFAKLIAWLSFGRIIPTADDFDMLWLMFRTLLPQIGGVVLMLASARRFQD